MIKIAKDKILVALLGFGGFFLFAYYIYSSQNKEFKYLKERGWYTIAIGGETSKERTGWSFDYKYKVNDEFYTGTIAMGSPDSELTKGRIYFVLFDPYKIRKSYLIRTPVVPNYIDIDSIPKEGWKKIPVSVSRDSITNFLGDSYF